MIKDSIRSRRAQKTEHLSEYSDSNENKQNKGINVYVDFKILTLFVLVRSLSVYFNLIWDCDETYNYWEPLHFLLHGSGLQTWEYSPEYSLRSYLYILIHAIPTWPLQLFHPSKIAQFYLLRFAFILFLSYAESLLYVSLKRLSSSIANYYLIFSLTNVGMFLSSTSFLPSTFSMYLIVYAYSKWLIGSFNPAIFSIGLAVLLGWPFVCVFGLPIIIDYLFIKNKGLFNFIKIVIFYGIIIAAPIFLLDSYLYGKYVFPPLNIFLYNVLSSKGGPDLYGREPFSYYIKNCILNFNILFPISILSVLLLIYDLIKTNNKYLFRHFFLIFLALFTWLAIFMIQPHKEERFLYPCYPLFLIGASVFLTMFTKYFKLFGLGRLLAILTVIVHFALSLMRLLALLNNYSAAVDIYVKLNEPAVKHNSIQLENREIINVCVGKEWYRYPSSFFMPEKLNLATKYQEWRFRFIEADFRGQLPGYFNQNLELPLSTRYVDKLFNEENKMVRARFFPLSKCDFLIETNEDESDFSIIDDIKWKCLHRLRFLNASVDLSSSLFKSFYVPFLYEEKVPFTYFKLFQRV